MSNYDELIGILKELLFNRFLPEPKIIKGLLGNGTGQVRVPNRKDFNYARFNRGSTESFEVFNKTVPEVNDWPILISELPWQPGLTQVVGTDWEAYLQSGWGDSVSTSNPHAPTHIWRDGFVGSDPLSIYMRAIAPGRAYSPNSTGSVVFVNSFEYGTGTIWPGIPGVDLAPLMSSIPTGTARFAGIYVNPISNSLGVVTGNTSVDTQAFDPPLVTFPFGVIPKARVRLYGGQNGIKETDFRDARRIEQAPPTGTSSVAGVWPLPDEIKIGSTLYASVSAAAAAASSGDVIKFGEGQFDCDGVSFPDGVTLVSAGNTTLYTNSSADCVIFESGGYVYRMNFTNEFSNPGDTVNAFRQQSGANNAYLYEANAKATNGGLNGSANGFNFSAAGWLYNCTGEGNKNGSGVGRGLFATSIEVYGGWFDGDNVDIGIGSLGTARLFGPVLRNNTFSDAGATTLTGFFFGLDGRIQFVKDGYISMDERATKPTVGTNQWGLYPKSDGFYQVDDNGAETPLFITGSSSGGGGVGENLLADTFTHDESWIAGTTWNDIADDTYGPSLWNILNSANAPDVLGFPGSTGDPFTRYFELTFDGTTKAGIVQFLDAQQTKSLRDQAVSLSVDAWGTDVSAFRMNVLYFTGTADSLTSDVVSNWTASNPTLATGWNYIGTPTAISIDGTRTRYEVENLTIPSSANNLGIFLWTGTQASGNVWNLARVKLEVGETATDFIPRSPTLERVLINKFVQVLDASSNAADLGYGRRVGTTQAQVTTVLEQRMRAAPTLSHNVSGYTAGAPTTTTVALVNLSTNAFINITGTLTLTLAVASKTTIRLLFTASTSFDGTAGDICVYRIGPDVVAVLDARL